MILRILAVTTKTLPMVGLEPASHATDEPRSHEESGSDWKSRRAPRAAVVLAGTAESKGARAVAMHLVPNAVKNCTQDGIVQSTANQELSSTSSRAEENGTRR
ncbi:hypothetical protein MTO96_046603 [Rhipicephalus appendiculatus]